MTLQKRLHCVDIQMGCQLFSSIKLFHCIEWNAVEVSILIVMAQEHVSDLRKLNPFLEMVIRAQLKHDEEKDRHVFNRFKNKTQYKRMGIKHPNIL